MTINNIEWSIYSSGNCWDFAVNLVGHTKVLGRSSQVSGGPRQGEMSAHTMRCALLGQRTRDGRQLTVSSKHLQGPVGNGGGGESSAGENATKGTKPLLSYSKLIISPLSRVFPASSIKSQQLLTVTYKVCVCVFFL